MKEKIIDSSLYQKSNKLFARISALPIKKGFHVVFLIGYLFAWGSILLDRQMLIEEQRRLREEIDRARIELKISRMIDEYGDDYEEMVIWNEEAIEPPKEGK